jgi:DNA-binding NarL/FixJ family response regulator
VVHALRAGARGYLTKDAGEPEILQALQRVLNDEAFTAPAVQRHLVDAIANTPPVDVPRPAQVPEALTAHALEVLAVIAAGLADSEIADRLGIADGTVKTTSITCSPRYISPPKE